MFTLLIIIAVIWVVVAANRKDKRPKDADEKIQELPAIHYKAPVKDKAGRFWSGELLETDSSILDEFNYDNGFLTLKMRDGKKLCGRLSDTVVTFSKMSFSTYFEIKVGKEKVSFAKLETFTKDEWDVIIGVLLLAGTTYGRDIFSSTYKNLSRANLVLKIISKL